MLTQPIIDAPHRLTHVHPPTGKEDLIKDCFPAENKMSDVRFTAGVHLISSPLLVLIDLLKPTS